MAISEEFKQEWLSSDNHRIVLMDLEYHDGTSKQMLRFASSPYNMPVGDTTVDPLDGSTVLSNLSYDDLISKVPSLSISLDSDVTAGNIEILNLNGELDHLITTSIVDGHNVNLYLGQDTWRRDDFIPILTGVVEDINATNIEKIVLNIRDNKEVLNANLQTQLIDTTYWEALMDEVDASSSLSTGNIVGGSGGTRSYSRVSAVFPEATEDTPVPIALGKCFNIEPVLVDSYNHVYLIHDTTAGIASVDAVRSNGVELSASQYKVDLTVGCIRLLDHDNGTQITCDVSSQYGRSDKVTAGSPDVTRYSAAHLIEYIILEYADQPFSIISQDTFPPTGSRGFDAEYKLGYYAKAEVNILDAINEIANSVGGFIRYTRDGTEIELLKFEDPTGKTSNLSITEDDVVERKFRVGRIEHPYKSVTLGYKKNWTPQEGNLAFAIVDIDSPDYNMDVYNELANEFSTKYQVTNIDTDKYPSAKDAEQINTNIWLGSDATFELARRVNIRGQTRVVYKITSLITAFTYNIGDIINITHSRYGFEDGKNAMIISITENPTSKKVEVEVWV